MEKRPASRLREWFQWGEDDTFDVLIGVLAVVTLASAILVSGCASAMTPSPTVYVDDSFAPDRAGEVVAGVASWTDVSPEVRPRVVFLAPVDLARVAALTPDDVVVVARVSGPRGRECPGHEDAPLYLGETRDGERAAATTWKRFNGSYAVICIDDAFASSVRPRGLLTTAAHEFGHALGLQHDDGDAVMNRQLDAEAERPTCADARKMAERWGIPVAPACED